MIKSILTNKGKKRFYIYSQKAMRWMPIKAAEAEYMIASEQVIEVPADTL